MGHKRKNKTPSPMKMLSIFQARKDGVGLPEIAQRTGHSISSITRWSNQHGDEGAFFALLLQTHPDLIDKVGFDAHYPKIEAANESTPVLEAVGNE